MRGLLAVHGLKRSGNHAIINWLLGQAPFEFFNNVIWINPILNGEPYPPRYENLDGLLKTRIASRYERFKLRWTRPVMLSLEDHPLTISPFMHPERLDSVNVLVLRDPRNLFASRIRMTKRLDVACFRTDDASIRHFVELWKSHAREFVGATTVLPRRVCIYYNAWCSSQEYRRSVSERLHLTFTDARFNLVSDEGGGSSFDGLEYDGKGSQMDVLNRHAQLTPEEAHVLARVLADEEVVALAARIEEEHPSIRSHSNV
jgi:hypothetical protein